MTAETTSDTTGQTAIVSFLGDVFPGLNEAEVTDGIKSTLRQADAVVINLESPVTSRGRELQSKSLHLRSNPNHVTLLSDLQTSVACLANNHMCDWTDDGIKDTLSLLQDNRIPHTGAGPTPTEARKPACVSIGELQLGFLAFGAESIGTVPATDGSYGCSTFDVETSLGCIRELKEKVDLVIVAVHWGFTNYHMPLPEHVTAARRMIDEGATAIVGHHPHVIQGYERRGNGVIVYSLGNFIFGRFYRNGRVVNQSRENRYGMVCELGLTKDGVDSIRFHHSKQRGDRVSVDLLTGSAAEKRERFLNKLSSKLEGEDYESRFRRYVVRRMGYRALRWCNPKMWRNINRAYLAGVFNAAKLLSRKRGG